MQLLHHQQSSPSQLHPLNTNRNETIAPTLRVLLKGTESGVTVALVQIHWLGMGYLSPRIPSRARGATAKNYYHYHLKNKLQ